MFKQIFCVVFVYSLCILGSDAAGRDSTHFCCSVNTTTETIVTRTRVVSQATILTHQYISNYTYCPPVDHVGIIDHIVSGIQAGQ
jgi:hypothetical protein